jgi:hypothetical protein
MASPLTSGSILDGVLSLVPSHTAGAIAAPLGEQEETVQVGIAAAATLILGALADSARKPPSFWEGILNLVSHPANSGPAAVDSLSTGIPSPIQSDLGQRLLHVLYPAGPGPLASEVAHETGLGPGSASHVVDVTAPLVLRWLSDQVNLQHLDAASLAMLMGSDRKELEAIPTPVAPEESGGVLPLWPILGVAALAAAMWYLTHA